jgi:hypothetical protein
MPASFTVLRWRLRKAGFVPVALAGKRPVADGWQNKTDITARDILDWERAWPSAANTGILTRETPAIDIDILDPDAAEAVEHLARQRFGDDGVFMTRFGRPPKRAILGQTATPFGKLLCALTAPNGASYRIEVLGSGQQIVVAGIHPGTGKPYTWHGGEPPDVEHAALPPITESGARAFLAEAATLLADQFGYTAAQQPAPPTTGLNGRAAPDWAKLLVDGAAEGSRDDTLTKIAGHLLRRYVDPRVVLTLLQSWNATSCRPPLPGRDVLRIVNSIAGKELRRRGR